MEPAHVTIQSLSSKSLPAVETEYGLSIRYNCPESLALLVTNQMTLDKLLNIFDPTPSSPL